MVDRLISFLKSPGKRVLLKYFFYEIKSRMAVRFGHIAQKSGFARGGGTGRINLSGQGSRIYGLHRGGWQYAVRALRDLHNPNGVILDAFIDRTFSATGGRFNGYSLPWIGFIHVPQGVPEWFRSNQTNTAIFSTGAWKRSIPQCKGLFTLSEYHRQHLTPLFDFPVENLVHPVEFPELTWSFERFEANRDKKIVQAGWWLRKVYSICLLEVKSYRKIILQKPDAGMERHLRLEMEHTDHGRNVNSRMLESVTRVNFLPDRSYDLLLSENIVFLDLFDSSANNAIIECIARNTPVLVNPLPAVKEYLGDGYPFYFNSLEEAALKAENMDLVKETHRYLADHPMKHKFTGEYFRESFINSAIYQSL